MNYKFSSLSKRHPEAGGQSAGESLRNYFAPQLANYPGSLQSVLAHQSLDATVAHAQGDGTRPTPAEQQGIVNFETALFTAQSFGSFTGPLNFAGANGGPIPLATLPFFISINSSIHALLPNGPEQPGGLVTPGDGQFTSYSTSTTRGLGSLRMISWRR
jgi:hypothetical protein